MRARCRGLGRSTNSKYFLWPCVGLLVRLEDGGWRMLDAGCERLMVHRIIDIFHKGVYAIISGYLCDRYIRGVTWFN